MTKTEIYQKAMIGIYNKMFGKKRNFLVTALDMFQYESIVRGEMGGAFKVTTLKQDLVPYIVEGRTGYNYQENTSKGKYVSIEEAKSCVKTIHKTDYANKSGLFQLTLPDKQGNGLLLIYHFQQGAKNYWKSIFIAEESTLKIFLKDAKKQKDSVLKPQTGIYNIFNISMPGIADSIKYEKINKAPNTKIVHDKIAEINDHIDSYFKNKEKFMINGRAGRKAILLYGPQGTGKSSIAYLIANKYKDTHCVAFSTSPQAIYTHTNLCAKFNIPTIIIYEDCEGALRNNNSEMKNFLSGIDAKQNKGGCYIIMTSNYPNQIESTIIKRKGRIDRLFNIGKLSDKMLVECVNIYFKPFLSAENLKKVQALFHIHSYKFSGSEVEVMAQEALTIASSKGHKTMQVDDVKDVVGIMIEEMKDLKNFNEYEFELQGTAPAPVGFAKTNSVDDDLPY